MKEKVYNLELDLNWRLLRIISQIDRFDASWSSIKKKEGQSLKQLKTMATIQSVGASTRIEGSKMTDKEVEVLLSDIDISQIEDRDSQEVVGYSNVLDLISKSYAEIEVTESNVKNMHNQLMRLSSKDDWHRGKYKQHTNAVEARFPDGTRQIVFRTTEPGYATEDAMRGLMKWYREEDEVHPLIKAALFVYDFVSIHPFQDGNGRLSRLLTNLLLLKSGYNWVEYISFEHEVENNKKEYYKVLRSCQSQRPNEDITDWINFFFESLINLQQKLSKKLDRVGVEVDFSPQEKEIYTFITNNGGCKTGAISRKLNISHSTVKRIVRNLLKLNLIQKYGKGAGTNYGIR